MSVGSQKKQMPPPTYYYGIDAVRLSCALMVAVFHLLFWSWAGAYSTIDQTNHIFAQAAQFEPVVGFTWYGWVGVEIFFVISGLVISNSASGASPLGFLKGRVLRLYPPVWICATCTLVALLAIAGDPISVVIGPYLKSMLLFPKGPWIDAVYWTLSVEIAFYALIFLILLTKTFALIHRVAWCLTFCSGIFNGIHLAVQLGAFSSPLYSAMLAWHPTMLLLLPHGCLFAVGIWLWLSANGKMTPARWIGLAAALIASLIEVYTRACEIQMLAPVAAAQSPMTPAAIWLIAVLIIALLTRDAPDQAALPKLAKRVLKYCGAITYPLYLLHDIVGAGTSRLLISKGMNSSVAVFLALSGLVAFCWFSCWAIEPGIRNRLRQSIDLLERKVLRPRPALTSLFTRSSPRSPDSITTP
jgi:peptidoglycan/LPS O-acetylase OafA/YrhL